MSDEIEVVEEEETTDALDFLEETGEEPEEEDNQLRGEDGRFAKPEQEEEGQPVEEPVLPEGQLTEEEVTYPPFTYRADGQSYTIEGSKLGEHGMFIPAESVEEVQRLLAEGRAHSGSFRQRMAESDTREATANIRAEAAEAQTKALMDKIESLVNTEGALEDFVMDQRNNWQVLKANAAAESIRVQGAADRARLEQYEKERQEAQQEPIMNGMLEDTILREGKAAGLSHERMVEIYQRYTDPRYRAIAFHPSTVDDIQNGISKGQMVIDYNAIREEVNRFRGLDVAKAPVREAKKPPPTVSAKKTPAPARVGGAKPKYATTEEADEAFERGDYNRYFEE